MALTGIQIFKITPKTNCKECGNPTCMAFAMKVAQGAIPLEKCPYISEEVKAELAEATAPPMKTIKVGAGNNEHTLGGETVLARHEKTFVSKNLYATSVCNANEDAANEAVLANIKTIDYDRIGERMYVEFIYVNYVEGKSEDKFLDLVKKAAELDRAIILGCANPDVAKKALDIVKDAKPILNGANAENCEAMNDIAKEYGVTRGVMGKDIDDLYDTVAKLEGLGNKNLVINAGIESIKSAFGITVQARRAAIKNNDRTFGYPSIVNVGRLAIGDGVLQAALASLFTMKYGSIIVMDDMSYAQALPLYGLRQNVYTDPQKPMRVEPGIYPLNGADENSVCALTVDFALSYFVISGEMERSGVPVNLLIPDAGGYSVLTAWAAGKLSASSVAKFIEEQNIEGKIKSRTLILPGKVAVLKGEIEDKLPGWNILVGPNEALQVVKFLKDL
jgi:acetyl-CoA decarbonylase/synthase complex subunit gamma